MASFPSTICRRPSIPRRVGSPPPTTRRSPHRRPITSRRSGSPSIDPADRGASPGQGEARGGGHGGAPGHARVGPRRSCRRAWPRSRHGASGDAARAAVVERSPVGTSRCAPTALPLRSSRPSTAGSSTRSSRRDGRGAGQGVSGPGNVSAIMIAAVMAGTTMSGSTARIRPPSRRRWTRSTSAFGKAAGTSKAGSGRTRPPGDGDASTRSSCSIPWVEPRRRSLLLQPRSLSPRRTQPVREQGRVRRLEDFRVKPGPSMRQITDLGDLAHGLAILPAGQSGNPCLPPLRRPAAALARREYHPLLMDRADIEKASEGHLVLTP